MTEEEGKEAQAEGAKRSGIPFYPLLFAIAPVLSVFGSNLSVFSLQNLVRPVIVLALGIGVVWLLLSAAMRSVHKGAFATLPFVALWWFFSPIQKALGSLASLPAYAVMLCGAVLAAVALAKWNPKPKFLNTSSFLLVTLLGANALARMASPPKPQAAAHQRMAPISLSAKVKPSIFYIVPDGFGRLDVLQEKHGINLEWFAEALRKRGFQIAEKNHSSYIQTQLSLASTLNLESLDALAEGAGKGDGDRRLFGPLITNSRAAEVLTASGYEHVTVGSGYEGIRLGGREVALEVKAPLTLFEASLLKKTPLSALPWLDQVQSARHRGHLEAAFRALKDLAQPGDKLRFVMAHLLTPHPPFVFEADGSPLEPKGGFAISDGDDYRRLVAGPEDYQEGYGKKVQYTAKKLLEVVDSLLAESKGSPPIIIIQGDHGSKVGVSHESLAETDLKEGFSCFYALYSPPEAPIVLPQGDANINTFRRIFTALGAKNCPPLEPRSWYSAFNRPLDFVDVTDRLAE